MSENQTDNLNLQQEQQQVPQQPAPQTVGAEPADTQTAEGQAPVPPAPAEETAQQAGAAPEEEEKEQTAQTQAQPVSEPQAVPQQQSKQTAPGEEQSAPQQTDATPTDNTLTQKSEEPATVDVYEKVEAPKFLDDMQIKFNTKIENPQVEQIVKSQEEEKPDTPQITKSVPQPVSEPQPAPQPAPKLTKEDLQKAIRDARDILEHSSITKFKDTNEDTILAKIHDEETILTKIHDEETIKYVMENAVKEIFDSYKEYIKQPLTEDQMEQIKNDRSYFRSKYFEPYFNLGNDKNKLKEFQNMLDEIYNRQKIDMKEERDKADHQGNIDEIVPDKYEVSNEQSIEERAVSEVTNIITHGLQNAGNSNLNEIKDIEDIKSIMEAAVNRIFDKEKQQNKDGYLTEKQLKDLDIQINSNTRYISDIFDGKKIEGKDVTKALYDAYNKQVEIEKKEQERRQKEETERKQKEQAAPQQPANTQSKPNATTTTEKSEQKAEKLTWETAYTIYDTAKTDLEQAEGAFNRVYESFRKGDSSLSSPENLLILVNKKYGKDGEKESYDDLITSLEDEIKRKKEEISKKTGRENLDINEIDKEIKEVKSNLTTQGKQLKQAEKKSKDPDKALQKINDNIKKISEELTEKFSSTEKEIKVNNESIEKIKVNNQSIEDNDTLKEGLENIKQNNLDFLTETNKLIENIKTSKITEGFDFKNVNDNINKLSNKITIIENQFKLASDKTHFLDDFQKVDKMKSEVGSMRETVEKIRELTKQKEAQQDMQKPESEFMKAQSEVKIAKDEYEKLQSNLKTLNDTKNALEEIQKLQQDIEEINQAKTVAEEFSKAIAKEKEAGDVLGEIQKKTYIDELVSRLKDGKWSERTTIYEGKKISLNEEINGLDEKFQKYFLTKALKQIYNINNANGEELQKQLGLDKNKDKEGIINYCIEETVKRCFENKYKEELFAKTRPSSKKNRINLTEIIKDINDTLEIEQNKAEQARQQAKGPTGFDKKVQERIVETVNLVKQGKAKTFRESYKQNLKDPLKHEIDVVALNGLKNTSKEQKKIYRKVVPLLFIHGTYAKMKFDQLNYDNRYKALDKVLTNKKLQNIKKFSKTLQKYPNDPEFIEGIKSACNQNEKLQGKALNAILPATKNVVIEDVDVLKKAFENIPQEDNGYSMTKPMKDDMAYFKILYARANEETREDFLNSEEFTTKFNDLSAEKQKKFIHFLEDIGEKEKIDALGLKTEQNEELFEGQSFSDKDIFKDWNENGISANMEKDSNSKENSKEEPLTPFYVFNQNGMSIKNDENLLAKETFKLQDSFLGLACAKDKKAFVNSNWMRAKQTRDKDGNKIEDKDEQITSAQVKAQRAAEKAAKKAIKEAGGDFNTIKKKTMPLLKNTKITFTFHGKPIPLSQAVRVCMELERRNRERELNMGIIRGEKIPEKTLIERISERLRLNVKEGCFSDEEKQLVQEAISAQIIATKAFNEELKNQIEAKGLKNGKKQVAQQQKAADNVRGTSQSFENGQAQKQEAILTINKSKFEEQIKQQVQDQSQDQSQPATSLNGTEKDSPVSTDKSSTKLETGSQPSIQQNGKQSLKDSAIIGDLATGIKKAAEAQPIQPANEERSILI